MAAHLKQIKSHMKSISNITKITSSMKMVAAAKFIRAEKALISGRPLGEGTERFYSLNKLDLDPNQNDIIVVGITSDRGLSGATHSKVVKLIRQNYFPYGRSIGRYSVVCVGEKCRSNLGVDNADKIIMVVNGVGHKTPVFLDASRIALVVMNMPYAQADFVFPKFRNLLSFEVMTVKMYNQKTLLTALSMFIYQPDDEELLSYVEFSKAAIVFYALIETYATELSARITAMSSASKNAKKLMNKLKLTYNRKRQAAITTEIIDIVSGAESVKKKKSQ